MLGNGYPRRESVAEINTHDYKRIERRNWTKIYPQNDIHIPYILMGANPSCKPPAGGIKCEFGPKYCRCLSLEGPRPQWLCSTSASLAALSYLGHRPHYLFTSVTSFCHIWKAIVQIWDSFTSLAFTASFQFASRAAKEVRKSS